VNTPPVILLGGESNALSIARQLSAMGVAVHSIGVASFVPWSRHLTAIPVGTGDTDRAWADALLGPATAHLRGAVLLAGSDVGLTFLARHREALLERYLLDVSNPAAQLDMLDKLATYEHAVAAGVPTPLFWRIDGPDDLRRHRDELVFPLIVKPIHSHAYQAAFPGLSKFRTVESLAELDGAYEELSVAGIAVMLVEKIEGPDDLLCSYYTYIDQHGTATFDFTKRIIRRHPPNMGIACYHITDDNPEVRDVALRLFKHVGLRGVANAEFKRDLRDGQLKLIECNARFTAANCLLVTSGLDLARHVYLQIVGRAEPMPDEYRSGVRLLYPVNDLRAFRELHSRGELGVTAWLRSIAHRQTFPYWRLRDPMPAIVRGGHRIGRVAIRGGAALGARGGAAALRFRSGAKA
jgi:predicted ATP-grasp superfamily ATP-dependent carboligase